MAKYDRKMFKTRNWKLYWMPNKRSYNSLDRLGAKYQQVVPFVTSSECPPNTQPTVEAFFDKKSGSLSGVLIEGQEVKLGG